MSEFQAPSYLSPSSINTFNQCPQKFKFSKLDGLVDDPTEATLMGNFVHDVLETLYKKENTTRTIESAKSIAGELWNSGWKERVTPWVRGDENLRLFRWKSWWCIENLWKIENPINIQPTGIEHELNGQINGVTIKGYIDRFSVVDSGTIISDYKTGKTPKAQYVDDKFFQLLVYAHVLNSTSIFQVNSIELLFLKDGVKFALDVTDDKLDETAQIVVKTKEEVDNACATGVFETRTSALCNWCSFKPICPAWRKK